MSNDTSESWLMTPTGPDTTGRVSGQVDDVFLPGDVIGGKYEVLDILGEGGFGVVYHGRQLEMGRDVAIKTLRRSILDYEEAAQRFRREAMLARHLTHPNTIRLYDFGETPNGVLYICMEYLEGRTLEQRIDERGAISMQKVADLGTQIAKSLTEAHQNGIVHRDLKPSNVFLTDLPGEEHFIKVLDFGIAKVTQPWDEGWSDKLTRTGTAFGSPAYMSPEQVRGRSITSASDIYAFGLIMLEALLGRQVIDGNSPFDVALKQASPDPIGIPPWIEGSPLGSILRKSVEKDAENRYSDAAELLDDLEQVDQEEVDRYLENLTTEIDFEELLQEAYEAPLTSTDEFDTPEEESTGRAGIIYAGAVVALVLVVLVATLVLTRTEQVQDSQGAVAQNDTTTTAPKQIPVASISVAHGKAAISGATTGQELPRQPLGVDASRLPIPLLPRSSLATPVVALANAYRLVDAVSLEAALPEVEITVEHPVGLPLTRGALMANVAGNAILQKATLTFDSRPRGATLFRDGDPEALGKTPLELEVSLSPREVTYRVEARGYRPVYLNVWHDRNYDGFAYMRKRRPSKANRFTVPD